MGERKEKIAEPINPFARRSTGVGLTARERWGLLALYLGLGIFLGQHLFRASGSSLPIAADASSASPMVSSSPGTILRGPPLAESKRPPR